MYHPDAVRGVHRGGDVDEDADALLQAELSLRVRERKPLDELHGDVCSAAYFSDFIDLADMVVLDARLGARFLQEAPCPALGFAANELERHRPQQTAVVAFIDHAHAALSDEPEDLIAIPIGSGERWCRSRKDWRGRRLPPLPLELFNRRRVQIPTRNQPIDARAPAGRRRGIRRLRRLCGGRHRGARKPPARHRRLEDPLLFFSGEHTDAFYTGAGSLSLQFIGSDAVAAPLLLAPIAAAVQAELRIVVPQDGFMLDPCAIPSSGARYRIHRRSDRHADGRGSYAYELTGLDSGARSARADVDRDRSSAADRLEL